MTKPTVHVGESYDRHEGRIDRDAAMAFALATNEPNEAYVSGQSVPPLFTVILLEEARLTGTEAL